MNTGIKQVNAELKQLNTELEHVNAELEQTLTMYQEAKEVDSTPNLPPGCSSCSWAAAAALNMFFGEPSVNQAALEHGSERDPLVLGSNGS